MTSHDRSKFALAAGLALSACTGDSFTLDVSIHPSAVVAVQDGDGPWVSLQADATGHAQIQIASGHYGLAHYCAADFSSFGRVQYATSPEAQADCWHDLTTATLSGMASPNAKVFVDSHGDDADATGRYSTWVSARTHDVFAMLPGAPAKLLVERGVDMSTDRVVDLPVAASGVAMPTLTPIVVGAAGPVIVYSDLNTRRGDYVEFGEDAITVPVMPPSLREDGDRPAIGARANGCLAQVPVTAETPTIEVPRALTATLDRTRALWQADERVAWDGVTLYLTALPIEVGVYATAGWFAASGNSGMLPIPDFAVLPGWGGAVTPGEYRWQLSVSNGLHDGDYAWCAQSGTITY